MFHQMFKLLIVAGIAFFVINKLISELGSTSDSDPAKQITSFFGESKIKDVISTSQNTSANIFKIVFNKRTN